jgi:hypothetical protein
MLFIEFLIRYCQLVSEKNRLERFYFSCCCLFFDELFDDAIFIDECTVEIRKESTKRWHKYLPIAIYRGKIGRARHNPKVQ